MAKKSKLGVASAIVVGAGAAALYAKKASENKQAKNRQAGKKADETQERKRAREIFTKFSRSSAEISLNPIHSCIEIRTIIQYNYS